MFGVHTTGRAYRGTQVCKTKCYNEAVHKELRLPLLLGYGNRQWISLLSSKYVCLEKAGIVMMVRKRLVNFPVTHY